MNTKTKPLGNVAKVQGGFAFKSEEFVEKGISIVRISNIVDGKIDLSIDPVHYQKGTNYKEYLLESKDILIAMSGATTGKIGRVEKDQTPCLLNQRVGKFIIKDDFLLSDYLYWVVQTPHYQKVIWNYAAGCAQPNISSKQLESINIPLPPLPTQHKIASILETCEAAIQKRKEANRLTDEFLKSTFLEMFGDPVRNQKGWPIIPLNEISLFKGQYGSGAAAVVFDPAKPRYIRITDINEDGTLNSDVVSPSTDVSEWNEYILDEGDILFARSGATVGKTFRYRKADGFCVFAGYLIRFKPDTKIVLPDYLFYFTRTIAFRAWIESKKKVVAQPNINAKQYGTELLVPLPSLSEQQKFANIVQKVEKLRQKQRESEIELTNLFNSLMQRVFRGEL